MLDRHGLRPQFDRQYASHLIGALKPDPKVFSHVSEDLGCNPSDILFFDDGPENVRGALRAGLNAYRVEGLQGLRARIEELGILSSYEPRTGR